MQDRTDEPRFQIFADSSKFSPKAKAKVIEIAEKMAEEIDKREEMLCYYCETNEATTTRLSEPTCEECNKQEFSAIIDPSKLKKETDRDRAERLKILMSMFRFADEEKRITTESTDPEELMDWLSKKAEIRQEQGMFKYDYNKFLNRWKELFGSTDNMPQSFKNNINAKYKGMRRGFDF